MSGIVRVRELEIGSGRPKIIAPVVGHTKEKVLSEAENVAKSPADLCEWRADLFSEVSDIPKVLSMITDLRDILGEKPLLFTLRTKKEGGAFDGTDADYREILLAAVSHRETDLCDIELYTEKKILTELIKEAHAKEKTVLLSSHDFEATPPKEELIRRFQKMEKLGADILKIAVMPREKKDVLTLLGAAVETHEFLTEKPVIAISMGEQGLISRLTGEVFCSACTFGSVGEPSAPGQIEVTELNMILERIHCSVSEGKKHLFLIGFMGAGKSTVAKLLYKKTGLPFIEMDQEIEKQEGTSIRDLFATKGEPYFRDLETAFLEEMKDREASVVSCGGGVCMRPENVRLMKETGTILLLTARPETILERVKDSTDRPLLNGHMNTGYISEMMEKRRALYQSAAELVIETDEKSPDQIAEEIMKEML